MSSQLDAEVAAWLATLELSVDVRNPKRDLSSGCVLAEILARYFPQDVSLHSFENVASLPLKDANWHLLRKILKRIGFAIDERATNRVMLCEDGAAVDLMRQIWRFLSENPDESSDAGAQTQQRMPHQLPAAAADAAVAFLPDQARFAVPAWGEPPQQAPDRWDEGHRQQTAEAYGSGLAEAPQWRHADGSGAASDGMDASWAAGSQLPPDQLYAAPGAASGDVYEPATASWQRMQQHQQLYQMPPAAAPAAQQQWQWGGQDVHAMVQWQQNQSQAHQYQEYQPTHPTQHAYQQQQQQQAPSAQHAAARRIESAAGRRPPYASAGFALQQQPDSSLQEQYWLAAAQQQQAEAQMQAAAWQQLAAQGYWQQSSAIAWVPPQPLPEQQAPAPQHGRRSRRPTSSAALRKLSEAQPQPGLPHSIAVPDPAAWQRQPQQYGIWAAPAPPADAGHAPASSAESAAGLAAASETASEEAAAAQAQSAPPLALEPAAAHGKLPTLAFDRRPRPVDFLPYTQEEFRQRNFDAKRTSKYWELGLLGPLPGAGLAAKLEARQRVRDFGRRLVKENHERLAAQAAARPPGSAERERPASARDRALRFSRSVQRPASSTRLTRSAQGRLLGGGSDDSQEVAQRAESRKLDELARLQAQHKADQAEAAAIARELGRTPAVLQAGS